MSHKWLLNFLDFRWFIDRYFWFFFRHANLNLTSGFLYCRGQFYFEYPQITPTYLNRLAHVTVRCKMISSLFPPNATYSVFFRFILNPFLTCSFWSFQNINGVSNLSWVDLSRFKTAPGSSADHLINVLSENYFLILK